MLHTLAIENYRSLRSIVVPLGRLNIIKGVNASGKSNLYKALRLLADTAMGGVVSSLAREGGLKSTIWAGPGKLSREMRRGRVPVQILRSGHLPGKYIPFVNVFLRKPLPLPQ